MKNEKELESVLSSMINTLDEMTTILSKSKRSENIGENIFYKNVEDGILNNIQNCDQYQLNVIMNSYKFRFYTEFNTDKELLRNEIIKRLRTDKLDKILK